MKTTVFKPLILFAFCTAAGCNISENKEILETATTISKKEDCQISYSNNWHNGSSELVLVLGCKSKDELFPGKVLLATYDELAKKSILHDSYLVKGDSGENYGTVNAAEIKELDQMKDQFMKDLGLFQKNDYDAAYNKLHDSLKEKMVPEWFNSIFENMAKNRKKWEFSGFEVKKEGSAHYAIYGASLKGEVMFWISYKWRENDVPVKDERIYGMGIIPL